MDRHILLTISDDYSALQAVRFVAGYFMHPACLKLSLFYVAANPRAGLSDAECLKDASELNRREAQAREQAQRALDKAEELLLLKQFPASNIHKKITFRQMGTARDIIQEGVRGVYDAIALGRRGLSRLEEFINDSVSKRVFCTPVDVPFWVCRNQEKPRSHVLLCVDGSSASLRCADHVGFMLKDEPLHQITLLHVRDRGASVQPSQALAAAQRMLEENGIAPSRIHTQTLEGSNAQDVILALAREKEFGVVATGRGEARSLQMLGSVSMALLKRLDFTTLWISH